MDVYVARLMPGTLVQGPQGWLCTLFPRFTISGLPSLASLSSVATVESILGDGLEYTADYARGKTRGDILQELGLIRPKMRRKAVEGGDGGQERRIGG